MGSAACRSMTVVDYRLTDHRTIVVCRNSVLSSASRCFGAMP